MFRKGMIISIKNLGNWKVALARLQKETDYNWAGSEGMPTQMPDSAFYKYEDDCAIMVGKREGNKVLYYGTLETMLRFNTGDFEECDVVSIEEIGQLIRRF